MLAREMFERACRAERARSARHARWRCWAWRPSSPRIPRSTPGRRRCCARSPSELVARYRAEADADWRWFEPTLTYDNALLPLALFAATRSPASARACEVARESLEFLEAICFRRRSPGAGRQRRLAHPRRRRRPTPTSSRSTPRRSCWRSAAPTWRPHDHHYLRRMRESFAWFLGANRLGAAALRLRRPRAAATASARRRRT